MNAEANLQTETAAQKKDRLAAEKKANKEADKLAKKEAKEAKELEKQKQDAEKKAAKEAAELEKKKKKETLADLVEDYNLKKMNGVFVPGFFHRKKRYADNAEFQVELFHAKSFLLGTGVFAEQGSCSAKLTYIGPNRRFGLKTVMIARRELRPKHGNWKLFQSPVRLFKGEEHNSKVKDAKIIRDFLTSQGGKKNFKIRFVVDKDFIQKEAKKKVFVKDPVRYRNMKYRMKRDQAKLGVKPVLRNKSEALLLIEDLKKESKSKAIDHVISFLLKEVKQYEIKEAKQKEEQKKD